MSAYQEIDAYRAKSEWLHGALALFWTLLAFACLGIGTYYGLQPAESIDQPSQSTDDCCDVIKI